MIFVPPISPALGKDAYPVLWVETLGWHDGAYAVDLA